MLQAATDGVPWTTDTLPGFGETGRNSWNISEAAKGNRQLAGTLFRGDSRAGWAFRPLTENEQETLSDGIQTIHCGFFDGKCTTWLFEPDRVNSTALTDVELRTNPVFNPFLNEGLLDETTGSAQALIEYPHLLAYDIPALSHAAGGSVIDEETLIDDNTIDMNTEFKRDGWPSEHKNPVTNEPAWYHSDFKDVAYLYTSGLYKDMVKRGDLK